MISNCEGRCCGCDPKADLKVVFRMPALGQSALSIYSIAPFARTSKSYGIVRPGLQIKFSSCSPWCPSEDKTKSKGNSERSSPENYAQQANERFSLEH